MKDELKIVSGNQTLEGWESISVSRGIERFPSSFDIAVTEKYPGSAQVVMNAGDPVQVFLGDDLVVTGYIDKVQYEIGPTSHSVRICGRSKCQDLVDCSAIIYSKDSNTYSAAINFVDIVKLANALCGQFGIKVVVKAKSAMPTATQISLNLGVSCYDVLEENARWARVLLYDDPEGNLVIDDVGTSQMSSGFTMGKNIIVSQNMFSQDFRYSQYIVLAPGAATMSDTAPYKETVVVDEGVTRFRPLIIVSEQNVMGRDLALERGTWEKTHRFGRSQPISIVTDSWRDAKGLLWQPNYLAIVTSPLQKLTDKLWIISDVTYSRDLHSGTTARLTLMPPEAYALAPAPLAVKDADLLPGYANATGGAPT